METAETVNASRVRCRRPGTVKLAIDNIAPEHRNILDYWWVNLMDLMNTVGGIVFDSRSIRSLSAPSEFFDRYGLLFGTKFGKEYLTWVSPYTYRVDSDERPVDDHRWDTFVPSGFSKAVIDLASKGIVSVTTETEILEGCWVGDKSAKVYNLVGLDVHGLRWPIADRESAHGLYRLGTHGLIKHTEPLKN